jgi:hypothetical protein
MRLIINNAAATEAALHLSRRACVYFAYAHTHTTKFYNAQGREDEI